MKTKISRLANYSLFSLAFLLSPNAHAQFTSGDLEGVWHVYTRWDSPVSHDAGYDTIFAFGIGPTGLISGGSLTSSDFDNDLITGGSLAIDAEGVFGGTVDFSLGFSETIDGFQLGPGSNATPSASPPSDLFLGAVTDSEGYVNTTVGIRRELSGFDVLDITGGTRWHYYSHWDLSDSGGNDPGWDHAEFRFRPTTGNRAAIDDTVGIDSEGMAVDLDDLEVAVQVDGRVTLLPIPGEFRMSRDKNWMAGVVTDPDGYRSLAVLLRPGAFPTQASLAGPWTWVRFSDDSTVNSPGWARGVFIVDAVGNIVRGTTSRSDGTSDWVVGGSLLVDQFTGAVSGLIDNANSPDDPIADARLSIGGNLLVDVASVNTRHGLTLATPAPEPGVGLGLAISVAFSGFFLAGGKNGRRGVGRLGEGV